jgi:hypothetical protein
MPRKPQTPRTPIIERLAREHRDVKFVLDHPEIISETVLVQVIMPKFHAAYVKERENERRCATLLDPKHPRRYAC